MSYILTKVLFICGFFNVNKIYINTNTDCHLFKNMMITGFM